MHSTRTISTSSSSQHNLSLHPRKCPALCQRSSRSTAAPLHPSSVSNSSLRSSPYPFQRTPAANQSSASTATCPPCIDFDQSIPCAHLLPHLHSLLCLTML